MYNTHRPNMRFEITSVVAGTVVGYIITASLVFVIFDFASGKILGPIALLLMWSVLGIFYVLGLIAMLVTVGTYKEMPLPGHKNYLQNFETFGMSVISPALIAYFLFGKM